MRRAAIPAVIGAFLPFFACSGDDSGPVATVSMAEYSFSPADLTVPKDSKVRLVNQGALVHSWILREDGRGTSGVQPGGSVLLDLKGVKPGRYTVFCDQVGHSQAGQIGSITIAP